MRASYETSSFDGIEGPAARDKEFTGLRRPRDRHGPAASAGLGPLDQRLGGQAGPGGHLLPHDTHRLVQRARRRVQALALEVESLIGVPDPLPQLADLL